MGRRRVRGQHSGGRDLWRSELTVTVGRDLFGETFRDL